MISQSDLHTITDKIGAQIYVLRTYLGEDVDTLGGAAATVCESLYDCGQTLIKGADIEAIKDLSSQIDSQEALWDWSNVARKIYAPLIFRLDTHLKSDSGTAYSGYSYFATENTGTRYCSEFARLLTLLGIPILGAPHIFYDRETSLGTFVLSGAGQGTWTAATSPWADGITDFGVHPSSALESVVTSAIDAGDDVDVSIMATDVNNNSVLMTTTIAAASGVGTKDSFISNGLASDNFIKAIQWVQVSGGALNDAFKIQFNPIRDIAL